MNNLEQKVARLSDDVLQELVQKVLLAFTIGNNGGDPDLFAELKKAALAEQHKRMRGWLFKTLDDLGE